MCHWKCIYNTGIELYHRLFKILNKACSGSCFYHNIAKLFGLFGMIVWLFAFPFCFPFPFYISISFPSWFFSFHHVFSFPSCFYSEALSGLLEFLVLVLKNSVYICFWGESPYESIINCFVWLFMIIHIKK